MIENSIETAAQGRISRQDFLRGAGLLTGLALVDPSFWRPPRKGPKEAQLLADRLKLDQDRATLEELVTLSHRPSPLNLRNDIRVESLEKIPPVQEAKLLTEEEKEEITRLHQELKDYYLNHPEIKEKAERTKNKLKELGFTDDLLLSSVLLRAGRIDDFSSQPTEAVIEMVSEGVFTLEMIREYSENLTGKNKQRLLSTPKETQYWQPISLDEEMILEMTKKTQAGLLGDKGGHFVSEVDFNREGCYEGPYADAGAISSNNRVEFYLVDEFKELDDMASTFFDKKADFLDVLNNLKGVKTDFEENEGYWQQAKENEEIRNSLLARLMTDEVLLGLADQMVSIYAESKAGVVSRILRHEVFGHQVDPLLFGYDFYSFEDELDSLELVTDYLGTHKELVQLPDDYQGERNPTFLWDEVFNIDHTAWADIVTAATDHDWLAKDGEVTPEQINLVNTILAKANLGLSVEKIKEVYQNAYKEAVAKIVEDCRKRPGYQELKQLCQDIEVLIHQFISEGEPTAIVTSLPSPTIAAVTKVSQSEGEGGEDFDLCLPFPILGLLGLTTWIIRRRMESSK